MRGRRTSAAGERTKTGTVKANYILAAPHRGSRVATTGRESEDGGQARWRLVERRLLSPARRDAIECLVRLERADGGRQSWRAGDMVELVDPFDPGQADREPFASTFGSSQHAGVGLLASGWPAGDWRRCTGRSLRLPIASGAGSPTLDLLVFSGPDASAALDGETRQQLLVDMSVDLRIVPSSAGWSPDDPLLFIGDFGAAALARAFAQEHQGGELVFLIEAGLGNPSLSPQAILGRDCWRDGTVRAMPALGDIASLAAMLRAHRRQIMSLIANGAPLLIAGTSPDFLSLIREGLAGLLGSEMLAGLEAQSRLRQIAL